MCTGALFALIRCTSVCEQVVEFGSVGSEYASVSEVPGSMDAMSVMEEERFIAAATFGLAGSPAGARVLANTPHTMEGAFELDHSYYSRTSLEGYSLFPDKLCIYRNIHILKQLCVPEYSIRLSKYSLIAYPITVVRLHSV